MYRQDLTYPVGVNGWTVGGSADALPFADRFFGAMTLHCSFEHFENAADTGLIGEAARVLRRGGRLCILPLYLADVFANITDPAADATGLVFDRGAAVHEVVGWRNRFGRFYDVSALIRRVLEPAQESFRITLHEVDNATDVDPLCYLRFALLLTRQ
jgi:SAM-dependent methyltransferase